MSNVSDEHQEVVFSEGNRKEEAVEFPKDTISRVYVDFNRVFLQVWEEEVWFFPWCCTSYRTYQGCDYVWDIITCSKLDFIGCSVIVSVCESVVGVNDSSVCMGVCDKQTHFHRSTKHLGFLPFTAGSFEFALKSSHTLILQFETFTSNVSASDITLLGVRVHVYESLTLFACFVFFMPLSPTRS